MVNIDQHGQPLATRFNAARNRQKALFSLLGLCQGLAADQTLSQQEAIFLDAWLRNNSDLATDADAIDIIDLLTDILKDGVVTHDELDDLLGLLNSVNRHRTEFSSSPDETNKLLALLRGIAADRRINDKEIAYIQQWISSNTALATDYPGNILLARIEAILADGEISEIERGDLLETLDQITGDRYEETGLAFGLATEFGAKEVDRLEHAAKLFCFTGKFVSGPRVTIEKTATERGAIISPRVSQKLDVLVIGTLASRDWRCTSHGRKIEQALALQQQGSPLLIITERHWREHL